jgi:hypothetical protein
LFRAAGLAGAALMTLAALPGAASAAAHATFTPKTGFSVYQSYGTQQGAVRGPGGRIWLIAMMPPQWQGNPSGSQALDAVNPTTGVVNYYAPLPPSVGSKTTLLAYDDGAPAFDGSGNAWMVATATTFSGARSHYLVRYTPGPSTSHTYLLPASCAAGGITKAGDGSVWVNCGKNKVIRVTAAAKSRTFTLSRVSSVGHFAAGPSGSMWAVGYNAAHAAIGLVRITSGGGEAYYATPRGITPRGLAGDGSSRVIETATCGARVCLESVSTSGKLSHVGTVPGTVRANWGPSMDASGNVWLLVDGSAAKAGQQFFLRLTSGNKTQTYAFAVPRCGGTLLTAAGNPAGSADGSAWIESTSNCTFIGNTATAYIGGLIRFKP